MEGLVHRLEPSLYSMALLAAAAVVGIIIHGILFRIMARIARRTESVVDDSLAKHLNRPAGMMIPLVLVYIAFEFARIPSDVRHPVEKVLQVLLIAGTAWILVRLTSVLEDIVLGEYNIADRDNLRARRIYTQFRITKRILILSIMIIALAAVLLSFEQFRRLGAGILASAGVAGIVLGVAARPVLSNLLAGIQIAFAEPIRLDDVVVVEGEWGRIEEITLTYVVVKIWDLRRLVVPIGYFLDKPFRNWTRQSADLIGSVYLYADYTVPVEEVRQELQRILKESSDWKGEVWALQVTDATEKTVQLRAIMDARDSSAAWNLRCEVREKLLTFIQKKYPDALPKVRGEIKEGGRLSAGTDEGVES